jgi:DNA-binding NarL/FixJ family response regulator
MRKRSGWSRTALTPGPWPGHCPGRARAAGARVHLLGAAGRSPLTARERDVLAAARPGTTVADIARTLVLSEGTVRNYLSAAIAKTGARNRAEAARIADERGWL